MEVFMLNKKRLLIYLAVVFFVSFVSITYFVATNKNNNDVYFSPPNDKPDSGELNSAQLDCRSQQKKINSEPQTNSSQTINNSCKQKLEESHFKEIATDLPEIDLVADAVDKWEKADYVSYDDSTIRELVEQIPVHLETDVDESQYEKLMDRTKDLLMLYKNQDAESYVNFYSSGSGTISPDKTASIRSLLTQVDKTIDIEALKDPIAMMQQLYNSHKKAVPQNSWESFSVELSNVRIYKAYSEESLKYYVEALPNTGVTANHLMWAYPNSTADIMKTVGHVKYASVRLQINHSNSQNKFPISFLFYWDPNLGVWQLKEGYSATNKIGGDNIIM